APGEVLGKYPHQLSGGQLQRLLIARALLLDIRFLVADEVISMLDASTRIDVLNLLAKLKGERGLSILFITHDLALGHYLSDQAVILYRGCVVERGPIDRVFARPQHPYTRMLLSSVPRLDRKWEEGKVGLKGQQAALTKGCVYHDRCPFPYGSCKEERPHLVAVGPGHLVACHRIGKAEVGNAAGKASGSGPV
ncbi:ABC transporter ATP-binding protein, partial [Candidatus Bipolaricaulota bacterium]|nr:ABC transporter ATP-binding protein [Candidatus Bipolaricaulota bacterium]